MSRRDKERKESLDLLGRIAEAVSQPVVPPKPSPSVPAPRSPPRPAARPPLPPARPAPPAKKAPPPPPRPRDPMEGRQAKLEEQRLLRERRGRELMRNRSLEWRGGGFTDIPASIRRTGFDRQEPRLDTKISDVLGAAREKEGRAKHRDKGRRQSG